MTDTKLRRIVECGCCGAYHPVEIVTDCRDDRYRFNDEDEALQRLGVTQLEVERFEYDNREVVEHFVETWPDLKFVEALPIA